jgi:hypothetical protein
MCPKNRALSIIYVIFAYSWARNNTTAPAVLNPPPPPSPPPLLEMNQKEAKFSAKIVTSQIPD